MSATIDQAEDIVRRHALARVCVRCDDYNIEGRLRPGLHRWRDGIGDRVFIVFGRASNWREYAEQFASDAKLFRRALRRAARPELHYNPFHFADRIEALERVLSNHGAQDA